MRKHAICPICKVQVYPNHANLTPRQELTNHLHYSDSQTWKRAKLMVKDSVVILEEENGKRSTGCKLKVGIDW
jgi:hypothetical protein